MRKHLAIVRRSTLHALRQPMVEREDLSSWPGLLDYLRLDLALKPEEQIRILFLNGRNHLILDEIHATGGIDGCVIYVREIIRRALELRAVALILVHNHPSGDPRPSQADIEATRRLASAARQLGITVHEHLIVGSDGHASFRAQGLL